MRSLKDFSRINLTLFPTPLQPMPRLGKALGIDLWFKRDDYTGFGQGGNKVRKLEYLMAEAIENKAQVVITTGGHQSNHARMVAAVARRYGMKPILVLNGPEPVRWQGNLLLDRLFDAEFEFLPFEDYAKLIDERMASHAQNARDEGLVPYIIPLGGGSALGSLGYVMAVREMQIQFEQISLPDPDFILTACGSGGTMAGLEVGVRQWWPRTRVIGISVSREKSFFQDRVSKFASGAAELLEMPFRVSSDEIWVEDGYVGPKYGVPSRGSVAAIHKTALLESAILDPVYTGKAMDGLTHLVQNQVIKTGQRVVFMHTGGVPSLYAFADEVLFDEPEESDERGSC